MGSPDSLPAKPRSRRGTDYLHDVAGTDYPPAPGCDDVAVLRETRVAHPCRWMEDDSAPELRDWLSAQHALTTGCLQDAALRSRVDSILECLPHYVPERLPVRRDDKSYYFDSGPDQRRIVLMCAVNGDTHVAFDATLACPGSELRLDAGFVFFSPSGRYAVIGLAPPGSDSRILRIHDLSSGQLLPDTLPETLNPVISWLPDESGFYYNLTWSKIHGGACVDGIYRHALHAPDGDDDLVFDYSKGAGHAVFPHVAADGARLYLKTFNFVTQCAGLLTGRPGSGAAFETLIPDIESPFNIVGEHGDELFLETRRGAGNGRVLAGNPDARDQVSWREVVPESAHVIARTSHACASRLVTLAGDCLYVTYEVDACNRIDKYSLDGEPLGSLPLPDYCTVLDVAALPDGAGLEVGATSYVVPFAHYRYTVTTAALRVVDTVEAGIDVAGITVSRRRAHAGDGTGIPLFLLQPESTDDGPQPVLMYGYGGWGSSMTPQYRPDMLAWLALGGSYAVPNIRGGGEFGEAWHRAGQGLRKQTVFGDFEAAAEHLVAAGIASPDTLVIRGLSNGGLLVTAVVNRRPDLFAAAVAEVPLVDVMHIMDTPVGTAIAMELGDPTADDDTFDYMLAYSPLQNIHAHASRPHILVVPAETDERVAASWSYKYVARLQQTSMSGQVALLRTVPDEGHVGWPWPVMRDVLSDELVFFCKTLGDAAPKGASL